MGPTRIFHTGFKHSNNRLHPTLGKWDPKSHTATPTCLKASLQSKHLFLLSFCLCHLLFVSCFTCRLLTQAVCISSEACICLTLAVTPSLLAAWLLFYPLFLHARLKAGSRCFATWRSQSLREMEPLWAELCRRRRESLHSLFADSISSVQQERQRELIAPPEHNHRSLISARGSLPMQNVHACFGFLGAGGFQIAGGGAFY